MVALDCPQPLMLAGFYSQLTGLAVSPPSDLESFEPTWLELLNDGMPTIAFQQVDAYIAPTWPDGLIPQQLHLDFEVDDMDGSEQLAISLGASKATFQPGDSLEGAERFRVFLDPVGHPFCLVQSLR